MDISGNNSANLINGTEENDSILAAGGNDTVNGLAGNDTILGGSGNDELNGGEGSDILRGEDNDDTLTGAGGDDTLVGGSGTDILEGGDGNDTFLISGATGAGEKFNGGEGDDTIVNSGAGALVFSQAGSSNFIAVESLNANGAQIEGDNNSNSLDFSAIATAVNLTKIDGRGGDDTIVSFSDTAVLIDGGSGDDHITGNVFSETLLGGDGNDTLIGAGGDDTLVGGNGTDSVDGGDGNDTFLISGATGNSDVFIGGEGEDAIVNSGNGALVFSQASDSNFVDVESLNANGAQIEGDNNSNSIDFSAIANAVNLTRIDGRGGNDTIVSFAKTAVLIDGGSGNDHITGNDLAETLLGGDDNDTLIGAGGDDTLVGGNGTDSLVGGDGNDTFRIASSSGNSDVFNGGEGEDTILNSGTGALIFTTASDANFVDVESLDANGAQIEGDNNSNSIDFSAISNAVNLTKIDGRGGNDTIVSFSNTAVLIDGGSGNDHITGNDLAETLLGGDSNDTLIGAGGDDTLVGSNGTDSLDGGEGNDTFQISGSTGGGDTFNGGNGTDTITNTGGGALVFSQVSDSNFRSVEFLDGNSKAIEGDNNKNSLDFSAIGTVKNVSIVDLRGGDDQVVTSYRHQTDDLNSTSRTSYVGGSGSDSVTLSFELNQFLDLQNQTDNRLVDVQRYVRGDDTRLTVADFTNSALGQGFSVAADFEQKNAILRVDGVEYDVNPFLKASGALGRVIAGDNNQNSLTGTSNNDLVFARSGNDTIQLGDGNNLAYSGAGNDLLVAGEGSDSLYGESGNDTIDAGAGHDTVVGGSGADSLTGGAGNDVFEVSGDHGSADTFIGGEGMDTIVNTGTSALVFQNIGAGRLVGIETLDGAGYAIQGDNNKNTLDFSSVNSSTQVMGIYGLSGDDTIKAFATGAVLIDGGEGNDNIAGNASDESLIGGGGNDTIDAGAGNDTIVGGSGADSLTGGAGDDVFELSGDHGSADTFIGGEGTDKIVNTGTSALVFQNIGTSRLVDIETLDAAGYAIQGDNNNNTLDFSSVGSAKDVTGIYGLSGNDTIKAFATGAVLIDGGEGNDNIAGNASDESLVGGGGNDTIDAGAGNDTIVGGSGADSLTGGAGDDVFELSGDHGSEDSFSGGEGTDTIVNTGTAALVFRNIGPSRLVDIETLDGNGLGLNGDNNRNALDFSTVAAFHNVSSVMLASGNDSIATVFKHTYSDTNVVRTAYSGGAGTDSIRLGFTLEQFLDLQAQQGNALEDVQLYVRGDVSTLTVNDFANTKLGGGFSVANDFENRGAVLRADGVDISIDTYLKAAGDLGAVVAGSSGNNTLSGTEANDLVFGRSGNDQISLGNGNDLAFGGADQDTVNGGDGNDSLYGESGNDRLNGDGGDDLLVGGTGTDTLNGGEGSDTYEAAGNEAENDSFGDTGTMGVDRLKNTGMTSLVLNGFVSTNGIDVIDGNNNAIAGTTGNNSFNFSNVTFQSVTQVETGSGNDSVTGTSGADKVLAGADQDTVNGGDGNDSLYGESGNDRLNGDGGDDLLVGGTGTDTLNGGEGSDTYEAAGNEAENDSFGDTGTMGVDTLKNTGMTSLVLNGFVSSNGIDVIDGNNNAIVGTNGNNTFNFSNVTFQNVTQVETGSGNDSVTGTSGADTVFAGNDTDTVNGGDGNDSLYGESGNDRLNGDGGDDLLVGGTGNDTMKGGAGNDVLEGGTGADTFVYTTGMDGMDTYKDFAAGDKFDTDFASTSGGFTFRVYNGQVTGAVQQEGEDVIVVKTDYSSVQDFEDFSAVLSVAENSGDVLLRSSGEKILFVAYDTSTSTSYLYEAIDGGDSVLNGSDSVTLIGVFENHELVQGDII